MTNSTPNTLTALLLRGSTTPSGWGFPPLAPKLVPSISAPLRSSLMFLHDHEGVAQLVRWYFGIIKGVPPVWRSLAGREGYDASLVFKPSMDSPTLAFCRDPRTGIFLLGLVPGPAMTALGGSLDLDAQTLTLGASVMSLSAVAEGDRIAVTWPPELNIRAGLVASYLSGCHEVAFRPSRFDAVALLGSLDAHVELLNRAGVLDSFLATPRIEDKLAIAWLAVARLEQEADL